MKINVYTLFIKRAKRVEIKLSSFYFESFQYQKFFLLFTKFLDYAPMSYFDVNGFNYFTRICFFFFFFCYLFSIWILEYTLAVKVYVSLPNEMVSIFRRIYIYCAKPFIPNETLTSIPIKTHAHKHTNIQYQYST